MQNGNLTISPAGVLNIPLRDAQALLEAGNGDAALLYLHILQNGGSLDAERAATALHRSDRDIEIAAGRLRQMGILAPGDARREIPRAPAEELPEYRAQDIARRSMESEEFQSILETVQQTLGRLLSSADVKRLFGLYSELGLPGEVIILLVQYCKERSEERYGRGRTVGFAYIEKEAYVWVNREIVTYEQADQWLRELERRKSVFGELRRELGIRDRDFSKTEREYIEKWLDLGFPAEAISIAADRTITNTHGLNWKYMDSIIASWHDMGLRTPQEIEEKDPRRSDPLKSARKAKPKPRDDKKTMEQLDRLLASMETNG